MEQHHASQHIRRDRLVATGLVGALLVGAAVVAAARSDGSTDAPTIASAVGTPTGDSAVASSVGIESSTSAVPPTTETQATDPTTTVAAAIDDVGIDDVATDDEDPDPEPGALPAGLVPIDVPDTSGDPVPFEAVPTPFTRIASTAVAAPAPATDTFVAVDFPVDPGIDVGDGNDAGGLHLTAATGCASHCIAGATVSSVDGSVHRYELRIELDNPAAVDVYVSAAPIERNADGCHVPPFSEPTASGYTASSWVKTFPLDPSTEYHVLIRATDDQGTSDAAGSFTTLDERGPGQIAAPRPCDDGCIDDFTVDTAADGTSISIGFTATADAKIALASSRDQFTQTDHGPTLPGATPTTVDAVAGGRLTLRLSDRTPNTAYSVLITATDALGGVDTWVARLATPSPTIIVGVDRVHISGDGDDGSLNRGEITFMFGTPGDHWGYRGEDKLASNSTVRLGRDSGKALDADGSGKYPGLYVYAGERDGTSILSCFVSANPQGGWFPAGTVEWCNNARTTWSFTYAPSMTLAEIEALPSCDWFDVANPKADRCAWVHTSPNSSDQVSFDMIVTFDIDPLAD